LTFVTKVRNNGKKFAEMQIMLQNVNKFSDIDIYFRKLSFWTNKFAKQILLTKIFFKVAKDFYCCGCRNLGGSWNSWGWGRGAQEVKLDLMPPRMPKVSIFPLFLIFRAASCGRPQDFQVLFLVVWNEKRYLQWHFCKEIALNNIILRKQARITYFFQNFEAKDHFAVTLYKIGRFFSALAARDRVKEVILNMRGFRDLPGLE